MMEEYLAVAGEDGQTHVLSPDLFATAQSAVWNDTDHFLSQHSISYVCIYTPEMPKQNATEQKKVICSRGWSPSRKKDSSASTLGCRWVPQLTSSRHGLVAVPGQVANGFPCCFLDLLLFLCASCPQKMVENLLEEGINSTLEEQCLSYSCWPPQLRLPPQHDGEQLYLQGGWTSSF